MFPGFVKEKDIDDDSGDSNDYNDNNNDDFVYNNHSCCMFDQWKLRAIFVTETIANRLSSFSSKSESEGSVNESIQKIIIK